eukprot:13134570-Alexandrium_andersonii.AAC.1
MEPEGVESPIEADAHEAEKFNAEGEDNTQANEAENNMESYCFAMHRAAAEEELRDGSEDNHEKKDEVATQDTPDRLGNLKVGKDEYEARREDLEGCRLIMRQVLTESSWDMFGHGDKKAIEKA